MDPGIDGRSTPVVSQLVKLPVIDRLKVVKDLMLGQLEAIHAQVVAVQNVANALLAHDAPLLDAVHAQVVAVQNVANALLANDSSLLESSINLVGAVHDTRLAVDRHGHLLLDTLRQARQDALRQTQELLHVVRRSGEAVTQREHLLLDTLTAGQERAERRAEDLLDAVQASGQGTREQNQALLDDARLGRQEAHRHAQDVLDTMRRIREETQQQIHRLLETLSAERQREERRAEGLLGAIRSTHEETREQDHLLLETLSAGQQKDEHHVEGLLGAIRTTSEETREQTQALLEDVRHAQQEAQRQAQELLSLVRSTRDETRERSQALLDDVGQARQGAQRQAREILDVVQGTQAETHNKADLLLEMLKRTDGAIAQRENQIETALGKLQALANEERQLLHDALKRIRLSIPPVEPAQGRATLLRGGYPEEPEVGLMAHLYSYVPSRMAVDIGANIGEVSHRLLDAGYEVFAFEPHTEVFRQLGERLSRHTAFHAFAWALGSTDETRPLHIATDQSGCNRYRDSTLYSSLLHHSMPDDLVFTSTVPVTVRSLASLHASGHIPADVSLVKIDTEGFDLEVIRGMDSHRYPVVVAEYWDKATPFGESGAMNQLEAMVQEMKHRDYHWYIVLYRVWGKEGTSFYCNYEHSVANAFGNVFFFRDYPTFSEALKWCAAVLPVTYLGG